MDEFNYNINNNIQSHPLFLRMLATEEDNADNANDNDMSPSVAFVVVSNILLFFLIFGLSATVEVKSLKHQLHNRLALATGVGMQFVVMPLLGFFAVLALRNADGFEKAMGLTLLVVTSSPGGSYSNWWCSLFNADLALSVAMTAVSTILSVGMLPANLLLYSHLAFGLQDDDNGDDDMEVVQALNFGALFISLGVVIGAICVGLLASWRMTSRKTFHRWANRGATVSGIALILVSALLSSTPESNFWSQPWTFYVGVAFPCCLGISIANLISRSIRLPKPECVAISVECCYQNTGIATSIAVTMFSDPVQRAQAVAVPLFYGIVEAVVIGLYCVVSWKLGWTKAPRDERIWTVMLTSYEVDDHVGSDHVEGGQEVQDEQAVEAVEEQVDIESLEQYQQEPKSWWRRWFSSRRSFERKDRDRKDTSSLSADEEIDCFGGNDLETGDVPQCAKDESDPKGQVIIRGRISDDCTVTTISTTRTSSSLASNSPQR